MTAFSYKKWLSRCVDIISDMPDCSESEAGKLRKDCNQLTEEECVYFVKGSKA